MFLNAHSEVLNNLKPVGNLFGLKRFLTRGLRVEPAAIPDDNLYL